MSHPRRIDRGGALLIAIILVIVVLGMAAAYLVVVNTQARRVREGEDRARSKAAAEVGIDHMRTHLLSVVDATGVDPTQPWSSVLATDHGTPAWATQVATPDGSYTVRVTDNDDGDGNDLDDSDATVLLESTGYGTAQGPLGDGHVIRCIVTLEVHDPTADFAILTGGDLDIYGDEAVGGTLGAVHTNEDLTLQGSANIAQSATASATTSRVGDHVSVGGELLANRPVVPIAPVVPADYRPHANFVLTADGRVLDGATGVQVYTFVVPPRGRGGPAPAPPGPYNGFTWSPSTGWTTATSGWVDGMYYIEGDVSFNHGGTDTTPWRVTLVAEGDIQMQGNPYLRPFFHEAELFVAGGDVYARGTGTNAEIEGLILAHEQVDLDGNITFSGRVVAEAAENSAGSLIDRRANPLLSMFGGSVRVTYNGGLDRSLVTEYRLPVRSWSEDLVTNAGH